MSHPLVQSISSHKPKFLWLKWFFHPIFVFVLLQIVWVTITILWVIWFVDQFDEISKLAKSFGAQHFDTRYALVIMIVGCILLGMLLACTVVLFVFGQRQAFLYAKQKNFVSSVTHELRSPLASIRLIIETLKARVLDADTVKVLYSNAIDECDRLSGMISQILVAARLDKGITEFEVPEETPITSINEIFDCAIERVAYLDTDVEKRVIKEVDKDLQFKVSQNLLITVITNLLENAIKYSPPASEITLKASVQEDHLSIAVTDQGYGIPHKERRKIFKMFYRSEVAHKKAVAGTGLGLFIVNKFVRFLGGRIFVESKGQDKGTTFLIRLPLRFVSGKRKAP